MKKIFSILAISTMVLAGCVKFESDAPVTLDSVNAPAISITSVGDNSITATITPAENTAYYAYALIAGPADELSGADLLANAYKSAAVVSKVAKAADEATLTIEAKNLDPNAVYTIYAVANTAMGAVSEIAIETKKTTDETRPDWKNYDTEVEGSAMSFYILFDDPVELTGKGHVFANFFAVNDTPDAEGNYEPMFSLEIPTDSLSLDEDGWLVVPVPQAFSIPGAIVAISYSEGIVKNAVGGENIAWDDIEAFVDEDGEFALDDYVIWEAYDNVNWDFIIGDINDEGVVEAYPEDTVIVFQDAEELIINIAPAEVETVVVVEGDIELVYTQTSSRKVSYTVDNKVSFAQAAQFGLNLTQVYLSEAPEFGAAVSVKIAEGEYQDIWGNENAAFEAKDFALMSYGYEFEDFLGTFKFVGVSYFDGSNVVDTISIVKAEYDLEDYDSDPEYDLMLTGTICGAEIMYPIYGWVDVDSGKLILENESQFYYKDIPSLPGYSAVLEFFDYDVKGDTYTISHPSPDVYYTNDWMGTYQYVIDPDGQLDSGKSGYANMFIEWQGSRIAVPSATAFSVAKRAQFSLDIDKSEIRRIER